MASYTSNPTLIDVATRLDPQGKVAKIAELLHKTNEVIDDATFMECNDGTAHKTTIRSGLPAATWRLLNYGVQPDKSTTVQVKDACGMLESYSQVDKALADLNGNQAAFRLSEDAAFLEAMNQSFVDTLFYGNTAATPERFMGLAPRYSQIGGGALNANNIIDGGGLGATNASIWLVVWGPNTAHCIYPKGSPGGLFHRDLGEQTVYDANNNLYQAYRTHFKHDVGFVLRDWRYVVRIANIDVTTLTYNAAAGTNLVDSMIQALELPPNLKMGRAAFYCPRPVRSFLRRQTVTKPNLRLALDEVAGKHALYFDDVPVRRCDSLLTTEARVV